MEVLTAETGGIDTVIITYVTVKDAMCLLGCSENFAYRELRTVNDFAEEKGYLRYRKGRASKYLFAEKYGIPIEVVDAVIRQNRKEE